MIVSRIIDPVLSALLIDMIQARVYNVQAPYGLHLSNKNLCPELYFLKQDQMNLDLSYDREKRRFKSNQNNILP